MASELALTAMFLGRTNALAVSPPEPAEGNGYRVTWNGGEYILTETSPKLPRP
jgi:hypothetical protein